MWRLHLKSKEERDHCSWERGIITCVLVVDMSLHICLFHSDKITRRAANGEHPLLLIHVERHMTDKLDIHLRLKPTHMAAAGRREFKNNRNIKTQTTNRSLLPFPRFTRGNSQHSFLLFLAAQCSLQNPFVCWTAFELMAMPMRLRAGTMQQSCTCYNYAK